LFPRSDESSSETHPLEFVAALEQIAEDYDPADPSAHFDYWLKRLQADAIRPWLLGRHLLELGCATGELTSLLAPLVDGYDVVEGSPRNIEAARRRVPSARFIESLWEFFEPTDRYTDIVLFNALEHSADPVTLLRRARQWLAPSGRIHVVVPNGLSLHRLVGVELGLQPDPLSLTDSDRSQGHRRNYTIDSLRADLSAAELRITHWQGLFLKMLSNRQMLSWDWNIIVALHRVGQRFPHHCAELLAVAEVI
jgi:trans-aconitate methyltransferase